MSNEEARELSFPLDFLKEGSHIATLWKDSEDAAKYPAHLDKEEVSGLSREDSIQVKLEKGGGFVMILH